MSGYKEVRAKCGEDRDGKAYYKTIGRVMETKNGPMFKLDMVPIGWDGWAYLSDPRPKEDAATNQTRTTAPKRQQASSFDDDASTPF